MVATAKKPSEHTNVITLDSNQVTRNKTVIFTMAENVGSKYCDNFHDEISEIQDGIRKGSIRNLVIDCSKTKVFGGAALGLLLRLWKTTQQHGGTFSMCGLSPFGIEMLRVVKLNRLWPIHPSLAEATSDLGG